MNNLKTKIDDLDVGKLKTAPVDLKKKKKINTLKTKLNSLEKKIPEATTLIHINQNNADKQNLEKKIEYVDKKKYKIRVV